MRGEAPLDRLQPKRDDPEEEDEVANRAEQRQVDWSRESSASRKDAFRSLLEEALNSQ